MSRWLVILILLIVWALVCFAQPVPTPAKWTLSVAYPAAEYPEVMLVWERATSTNGELKWEPFVITAVSDPKSTTNMVALYRVGVHWRTEAPQWFNEWLTNRPKIVYVTNTVIVRVTNTASVAKALPMVQTKGATR